MGDHSESTSRGAVPLLQVDDISVAYGGVPALRSVSIEVALGETVAVMGANGAGKSSLLRAVSGAVKVTKGDIRLDGNPIANRRPDINLRAGISHVLEGRHVFPGMTVEENLRLGMSIRRDDRTAADLEAVYAAFPILWEYRRLPAGALSGGQQQMVVTARALLSRPTLVLLDEPSLGLAPVMLEAIVTLVDWAKTEFACTVIVVEQHINLALAMADRCYVMARGQIGLEATAQELRDDPEALRQIYLH